MGRPGADHPKAPGNPGLPVRTFCTGKHCRSAAPKISSRAPEGSSVADRALLCPVSPVI